MPCPLTERQALARERQEELPAQIAAFEADLVVTPPANRGRREMRAWQSRRVRLRLAKLDRRLAGGPAA